MNTPAFRQYTLLAYKLSSALLVRKPIYEIVKSSTELWSVIGCERLVDRVKFFETRAGPTPLTVKAT
jgi:hypothetical protein